MSKWERLAGSDEVIDETGEEKVAKKQKKRSLAELDAAVGKNCQLIDMLEDETLAGFSQRKSTRLHVVFLSVILFLTICFIVWQHLRLDDLEEDLSILERDFNGHSHRHAHPYIPHYHY